MAELVECARLEIAYTGNRIGGSNPSISAMNKKAPKKGVFFLFIVYGQGVGRYNEVVWGRDGAKRSERGPRTQRVGIYSPSISARVKITSFY